MAEMEVAHFFGADDEIDLAKTLNHLRRQFLAHREGGLAFTNTLYASVPVNSPIGRLLDRFSTSNSSLSWRLEDAIYDAGAAGLPRQPGDPSPEPSPVAAAMILEEPVRTTRRKQPLMPAARNAACAYARERIALLEQAQCFLRRGCLNRELRTWQRLLSLLDGVS